MLIQTAAIILAATLSVSAQAKPYKVVGQDVSPMCRQQFDINTNGNVIEQVIWQLAPNLYKAEIIEKSYGHDTGDDGELKGDYLYRTYLVKSHKNDPVYKYGVYRWVVVQQYGKRGTNELKGFIVRQGLVNHHGSAVLRQDIDGCTNLTYLESK